MLHEIEGSFIDQWMSFHSDLFYRMKKFEYEYKTKGCPRCDGYDNWREIPEDLKQNYLCKHLIEAKSRKFNKETSKAIEELIFTKLVETEFRCLFKEKTKA